MRYFLKLFTILLIFILFYIINIYAFDNNAHLKKLTLKDAVSIAIKHNRTIILATLSRDSDRQNLILAKDQFNFHSNLSLGSSYYRQYSEEAFSTHQEDYSLKLELNKLMKTGATISTSYNLIRFNEPGSNGYNSATTISFRQPLLKGFGKRIATASLESSKINDKISIRNYEDTISSIISSTIKAFRNLVLAKKQFDIVKRSIELSKKLLNINQELFKAGRLAEINLIEMKADLINNQMQLLTAKNMLETAQINLIRILGLKTDINLHVIPEKLKIENISKQNVIKTTFSNRRDYLNARDSVKLAELSYDVAKNNMLWDLSFSSSLSSTANNKPSITNAFTDPFKGKEWEFKAGFVLNIPLTKVELKTNLITSKNSLKKSKVALMELKENILSEVRDILFRINTARLQIEHSKTLFEVSKKKVEAEIDKYKAGKTTNFQLLSYKNQLVQSEIDLLSAKINYMNLITDLERTEGILYKKWESLIPDKIKSLMEN